MSACEYRYVTCNVAELEIALNEFGKDGWGIAHLSFALPHVHIVLFREKLDGVS